MATHKPIVTKQGTELPLLDMRGKPYLQVAHRLVWFREEHPLWSIKTEFLRLDDKVAICRATVANESGTTIGMASKREDQGHFADHMEKAETGAIGRALALCGYGTQFEPELDEGLRLSDSPIDRPKAYNPAQNPNTPIKPNANPMTDLANEPMAPPTAKPAPKKTQANSFDFNGPVTIKGANNGTK